MDKKRLKAVICAAIAVALTAAVITAVINIDSLESVETDETSPVGYTVISHMKSGADPGINVSYMLKPLADEVYRLSVVISGRESGSYDISNIRAKLTIPGEPVSEYAACSVPGGYGHSAPASVGYDGGNMVVSYETDGSDINLDMFLTGSVRSAQLELCYDISGRGLKLLNGFVDNAVTLELMP